VHPSLIAGEVDGVLALKGSNLVVEAMLSTIKDFETTLAGLLAFRFCINKMASFCLIGSTYGPFDPDIAFNIIFPRLKFFLICLMISINDTNSR
jgi:tetrahydromethanopterin S-methyltransferase subunit D